MMRAVFLDRDGVLNAVVMRDGQPCSPRTFDEFALLDGVAEPLVRLKAAGFRLIVVTNQPDITRGKMTADALACMTEALTLALPVDEVRVCPHDDAAQCACRKPHGGMLRDAAREQEIDLAQSFLIGDSWRDMGAARDAGCLGILLDAAYNAKISCDLRMATLHDAVEWILTKGATR